MELEQNSGGTAVSQDRIDRSDGRFRSALADSLYEWLNGAPAYAFMRKYSFINKASTAD